MRRDDYLQFLKAIDELPSWRYFKKWLDEQRSAKVNELVSSDLNDNILHEQLIGEMRVFSQTISEYITHLEEKIRTTDNET